MNINEKVDALIGDYILHVSEPIDRDDLLGHVLESLSNKEKDDIIRHELAHHLIFGDNQWLKIIHDANARSDKQPNTKEKTMNTTARKRSVQKFYQYTDYPRLFKDTYWGNLGGDLFDSTHKLGKEAQYRNKFARDYKLHSVLNKKWAKFDHEVLALNWDREDEYLSPFDVFDHTEVYATHSKKIVLITSPYEGLVNHTPLNYQLVEYKHRLFDYEAETFIIEFKDKQDFKQWYYHYFVQSADNKRVVDKRVVDRCDIPF